MKDDLRVIDEVRRPMGDVNIVYFSSTSNNTHRFMLKLKYNDENKHRIPVELDEKITVDAPYVIITPTYSGGSGDTKGAVPKQVIQFLNDKTNRDNCYGVIASGNTNFNDTFGLAGEIISSKLQVPLLFKFELLGTASDVTRLEKIIDNFWEGN